MILNDARICSRYIVASASSVWFSCTPSILVVKVPGLSFALHNDDDDDDDDDDDGKIREAAHLSKQSFCGLIKQSFSGLISVGADMLCSQS